MPGGEEPKAVAVARRCEGPEGPGNAGWMGV